jgi:hypothetical protein
MKRPVKELVIEYVSTAECKLRPNGKEYYEIIKDEIFVLGQGKTPSQAWKAAWNNLN